MYGFNEVAIRFHHRLVFIHPFSNGNGRHAREITDLLLMSLGCSRFHWGKGDLNGASVVRQNYMRALRMSDQGNYSGLSEFLNLD